jgi:hypothetical protein
MQRQPLRRTEVDVLVARLFAPAALPTEDHHVYAVLDGARDRRICAAVREAGLPSACLFAGPLHPALEVAAPYLVQLREAAPFVRIILEDGWGDAWGIFATSTGSLEGMRRHLRRLLRVADESGRRLFFRYYDPRVFRLYLPTCTADELRTVFGPVERFAFEAEDPGRLIACSLRYGRLVEEEVELQAPRAARAGPS